jgi:hypothetical protein
MKAITADLEVTERRFGKTWNSLALFLLDSDWRYWLAELKDYLTYLLRRMRGALGTATDRRGARDGESKAVYDRG